MPTYGTDTGNAGGKNSEKEGFARDTKPSKGGSAAVSTREQEHEHEHSRIPRERPLVCVTTQARLPLCAPHSGHHVAVLPTSPLPPRP